MAYYERKIRTATTILHLFPAGNYVDRHSSKSRRKVMSTTGIVNINLGNIKIGCKVLVAITKWTQTFHSSIVYQVSSDNFKNAIPITINT